jgi:hypothetical protein
MITKPPSVTPRDTLREQTGKETVSSYVTWTASKCHFKSQFSDDEQIRQLSHFIPTHDKNASRRVGSRPPYNS